MSKRYIVSLLCALVSLTNVMAQELKEVTHIDGSLTEQYTVLRKDKNQKHGNYQSYMSQRPWEKGQYDKGQRVGVWEFYGPTGELDQRYDYTTRRIVFTKEYKERDTTQVQALSTIIVSNDTSFIYPAKPPVPIGGSYRLAYLLMRSLRYPATAQRSTHRGQAIVAYVVDENGQFGKCRLLRSSANQELDQEALRVVKLFGQLEWVPAEYNGRSVSTVLTQPVRFLMER